MLLGEAVLPVASRYGVTVCWRGSWTVTLGGGGATNLFSWPHALSSVSIPTQARRGRRTPGKRSRFSAARLILSFPPPAPLSLILQRTRPKIYVTTCCRGADVTLDRLSDAG